MTSCALTASAGPGSYRAYHGVVSPAAPGSGTLRRLPPKHRAEGAPDPASRRLARAELLILGVRDFYFCREIRRTTVCPRKF